MLALCGIEMAYGPRRVLAGVDLRIGPGEAVLLVGRNGAGKTTLLRIACGFLDPVAGNVEVDGLSMARDRRAAQSRIGYLPEHAPAPHEITVRDHLRLRARKKGLAAAAAARAVDGVLDALSLTPEAARPIGVLSKGYRQRVGLADALLGDPPLLMLDEPTSGMDPIQTRELCERLAALAGKRAVLVSSHAVSDLETVARRVVVLAAGSLIADAPPADLCARTGEATLDAAVLRLLGDVGVERAAEDKAGA